MKKILLRIEGMTCSACSTGLEKFLSKQIGIQKASVNLVMANALIEYDEAIVDQKKIESFIKKAGFKSLGLYEGEKEEKKKTNEKIKFILFTILAIILLYLSMGPMVGIPIPDVFNMHHQPILFTSALFLLTLPFLLYGWDILKNGYLNLIHKAPNMDTLVAIGVLSSMGYSVYGMILIFRGNLDAVHNLYFETAAIVIYFIKLGRYLDGISKDKTKEAIQKLVQITPNKAILKIEGKEKEVTIDEIKKGDIVVSHAGERIAVDGKIVKGKAHLDESFMTGESKPVNKTVNQNVVAGSINFDGYLEYEAQRIGKDSTISQIVKLVVEATNTKAPIAKIADRVSGYFVPIVMGLSILTFLAYLLLGIEMNQAVSAFVTILVVACPCSLGLATPLAIVVSEGLCASHGILVKKSEILENAQKVNTIVFDKTGTLTYGKLKIGRILNFSTRDEAELLQQAGSVETKSNHPISRAFTDYLQENHLSTLEVEEFQDKSGYGIQGKVEGKNLILGNSKILDFFQIENPYGKEENDLAREGNSIVYFIQDKQILAMIGVKDQIRENAKEMIRKIEKEKIEIIMLTGDHPETAERIAQEIGIHKVIANVTPTEKVNTIRKLKQEGRNVLMCGDGINDSPALAHADVGVSIHSGTDIAMDSSEVILMKNDLAKIMDLIHISKKTIRNIQQNLFWAFFYNSIMIPIAMGILKPWGISINPMIAGFAMVLSSLTVILNALRLKKIKLEGGK